MMEYNDNHIGRINEFALINVVRQMDINFVYSVPKINFLLDFAEFYEKVG